MDLKFKTSARIAKPVAEVFEAVVDPGQLSQFFATGEGTSGRLESGATVTWDFHDFPGAFPVNVETVVANKEIVLHWDAVEDGGPKYQTTVRMDFEALDDGRTLVTIAEEGWHENQASLKASYGNASGWTHALCALKVWLEHGIHLRDGFYK